jgi:hypothetical protein
MPEISNYDQHKINAWAAEALMLLSEIRHIRTEIDTLLYRAPSVLVEVAEYDKTERERIDHLLNRNSY